jgi:threonylcarbamoyladenosine tRNA methylthiotransferase MtaB
MCIINTCTVTARASMQSRQEIRKAIRSHPQARIVATGCYAQTEPEALQKISGITDIIGHDEKNRILELPYIAFGKILPISAPEMIKRPDCPNKIRENPEGTRARPFVKIQDGCNGHCTYCIVPSARGQSRSTPIKTVCDQIRLFANKGYHEVVLTGIHMGSYGSDLTPSESLSSLLFHIRKKKIIGRIRLSSIEPRELTGEIIKTVAGSGCFCRHFHIPLQSGDDRILRKMGRPYTREFFKAVVLDIHQRIPDAAIGTDVLIGFPGETDTAFENTLGLVKELPLSYFHVFPFSPRRGTPAAGFPNQIPVDRIKQRSQKIRKLGNEKKNAFYRRFLGKRVEMVVEGNAPGMSGYLKGTTSNYIPVNIRGENSLRRSLIEVVIDHVDDNNIVKGIFC